MKASLTLVILLLCAAARPGSGDGIIVGYSSIQAVEAYPQSVMDDIAGFRWFFAHASVGGNMMNGIQDLNASSNTFYRFRVVSDDSVPPAVASNAVICDYNRGNPGWQAKMDGFQTYVSNGWRFPKVNLAMDKLCYIDQGANVDYYIAGMTNLEAAHPETVFVYATIPLTTSADADNDLRNTYNKSLRSWVRTNNRVLFDIADIEAHDTNGVEYTYTYSGRTNQMMYSGNSSDGGHLGAVGRGQVARGFYAVCYALLQSDRDRDGMSDGRELIAGMRPAASGSVFKLNCPSNQAGGGVVVSWPSASNRFYVLQRLTNLVSAGATNLLTNAAATPPVNCYTDSAAGAGPYFYRAGVRQ